MYSFQHSNANGGSFCYTESGSGLWGLGFGVWVRVLVRFSALFRFPICVPAYFGETNQNKWNEMKSIQWSKSNFMRISSLFPSARCPILDTRCWTIKIFGLKSKPKPKPKLSKIKSVAVWPKSCGKYCIYGWELFEGVAVNGKWALNLCVCVCVWGWSWPSPWAIKISGNNIICGSFLHLPHLLAVFSRFPCSGVCIVPVWLACKWKSTMA